MRIIVIGAKGLPGVYGTGGVEIGVERLNSELIKLDNSVLIYTRGQRASWRRDGKLLIKSIPYLDLKNHAFWTHTILCYFDYLSIFNSRDIIHIHNIQNGFIVPFFKMLGVKVVFHLHGPEWKAKKWNLFMRLIMRLSLLPVSLFSNAIISVNPIYHITLLDWFSKIRKGIYYVPNGIPVLSNQNLERNDSFLRNNLEWLSRNGFWLYVGRIVHQKNIIPLIKAYQASYSPFPLIVVGDTSHSESYYNEIRQTIRELNLERKVLLLGYQEWSAISSLYQLCRAVILISYSEGCSNVICEAIAFKKLIICSDIQSNRAFLGERAIYIDIRNIMEELTAVLNHLDSDANLRSANNTINELSDFPSWSDVAICINNIYVSLW